MGVYVWTYQNKAKFIHFVSLFNQTLKLGSWDEQHNNNNNNNNNTYNNNNNNNINNISSIKDLILI